MLALRPRWPLLALLSLSLPLGAVACDKHGADSQHPERRDPVDALSHALLDALTDGDREALAKLASPALEADLDHRDLAVIAQTLLWLGPATLEARGDEAVAGGTRRSYLARFDRGELEIEVVVVGSEVEGFVFEAGGWERLVERAAEVEAGSLRVASFGFQGPAGEAIAGPVDPADIRYELTLEGLEAQLREHHVLIDKVVIDGNGNEVYRQRQADDIRFPQAETGSSGGRVSGTVAVPKPGAYTLRLEITDVAAGETLKHDVPFAVPAAG